MNSTGEVELKHDHFVASALRLIESNSSNFTWQCNMMLEINRVQAEARKTRYRVEKLTKTFEEFATGHGVEKFAKAFEEFAKGHSEEASKARMEPSGDDVDKNIAAEKPLLSDLPPVYLASELDRQLESLRQTLNLRRPQGWEAQETTQQIQPKSLRESLRHASEADA